MISAAHRRTSADQILQAFGIDGAELMSNLMGGAGGALRPVFQASFLVLSACAFVSWRSAEAQQEPPYFVTYSSVMEEPGNLDIENQNVTAAPKNARVFFAPTVKFEYGTTAWWTTEV